MTCKELLDKQIDELDALLEMVEEDWETDVIQADKEWFARLVTKTRVLRDDFKKQREMI